MASAYTMLVVTSTLPHDAASFGVELERAPSRVGHGDLDGVLCIGDVLASLAQIRVTGEILDTRRRSGSRSSWAAILTFVVQGIRTSRSKRVDRRSC